MDAGARYYEIAGLRIQVESDLDITDATFHPKFEKFRVEGPGEDTVVIRHHFGPAEAILGRDGPDLGEEVYRKPPWAIRRARGQWIYQIIPPEPTDLSVHSVAVFNDDHTQGDIYNREGKKIWWERGGLTSLTMFPSDQIILTRLLANRQACILHSGAAIIGGQGLMFVGHSDAGKSTTMALLRRGLEGRVEILCDDRNVVRDWPGGFRGGKAGLYLHGTWSHGDMPEVSAGSAPLGAVLFLEQHIDNELVLIEDKRECWARLLSVVIKALVTVDWWEKELDVIDAIVAQVPCYVMRFDRSGAIVRELEGLVS